MLPSCTRPAPGTLSRCAIRKSARPSRSISRQAQDRLNRMAKQLEKLARFSAHHGGTDDYWRRFDEMLRIAAEAQAIWRHQPRGKARQAVQS